MSTITCPYCKNRFGEEYYETNHVPCPERVTDVPAKEHCRRYVAPMDDSNVCLRCRLPHDKFYGDGTPKEVEKLRRDRLLYGNSFELNGKRVDPRHVVLHDNGTYKILEDPDA
jgi:hypothetical protein